MVVYHQAIHYPRLTSHLMYPMQSRMLGVITYQKPKFLGEDLYEKTHTIIVNDQLNPNEPLVIPLSLKGVTSYLTSRKPKASEYEDEQIPHINMTSKAPVLVLYGTSFEEQEDSMNELRGEVISSDTIEIVQRTADHKLTLHQQISCSGFNI